MVGSGSGRRGWVESDGVGVGVGVWEGTVMVDVGLALGSCEEDEGIGFVSDSSAMSSIGVAVSGLASCGRPLELR